MTVPSILDSKSAANHFIWQNNLNRRKRKPNQRGRARITLEDYEEELRIKTESVQRMDGTLAKLRRRVQDEVLDEIDLAEYEELLQETDEDDDSDDSSNNMANGMHEHDLS